MYYVDRLVQYLPLTIAMLIKTIKLHQQQPKICLYHQKNINKNNPNNQLYPIC